MRFVGAASLTPPACFASRAGEAEKRANETAISPSETKRFAGHALSLWNPYERRIRHFAGLFVFKDLTPFSFRRIHGLFVFNDLAPFFVSPVSPKPVADPWQCGSRRKGAEFPITEMVSQPSGFVNVLFAAATIEWRKIALRQWFAGVSGPIGSAPSGGKPGSVFSQKPRPPSQGSLASQRNPALAADERARGDEAGRDRPATAPPCSISGLPGP